MEELDRVPLQGQWRVEAIIERLETAFGELHLAVYKRAELTCKDKQELYQVIAIRKRQEVELVRRFKGLFLKY